MQQRREQADRDGKRGHQDRTQLQVGPSRDAVSKRYALLAQLLNPRHKNHSAQDRNAEKRHEPNSRGDTEIGASCKEGKHASDQRGRTVPIRSSASRMLQSALYNRKKIMRRRIGTTTSRRATAA